jgi:hypothetical protein
MSLLQGFPIISQLTTITEDGLPNKDAPYECVATAILAGVMWLDGVHAVGGKYTPDYYKDQAYGEAYIGATSADRYIAVCKQFGVILSSINGTPAQLIQHIHEQLAQQHPVIVTVPDVYVPASYNWSHVLAAYGDNNGLITCLDPYIAKPITRSNAEWEGLLQFNQIWIVEKEAVSIDIHNAEIARHFKELNAHQWQSIETGKTIRDGMLASYKVEGNRGLCGWDVLGEPMSNEIAIDGHGSSKQFYQFGVRWYNALTKEIKPMALYDNGPGTDPRIAEMTATIATLQKQLSSAPDNAALRQHLDAATQELAQAKTLVA